MALPNTFLKGFEASEDRPTAVRRPSDDHLVTVVPCLCCDGINEALLQAKIKVSKGGKTGFSRTGFSKKLIDTK